MGHPIGVSSHDQVLVTWRDFLQFQPGTQSIPGQYSSDLGFRVEAKGLEPSNLLTASQALYQLSYAPVATRIHCFRALLLK